MMLCVMISTAIPDPNPSGPDMVGASASVLASTLVADILAPAMEIENGRIIIPKYALFRMAVEIEAFAKRGGRLADEVE